MGVSDGSAWWAALALLTTDSALWPVVGRSLAVSGLACLIACSVGLLCGAALGVWRGRGHGAVQVGLNTLLALPSVVVGLLVYVLLSRSGPLGSLGWLFSFKAMVLAQAVLVWPIATALTRQVVASADQSHGEQLQSLGLRGASRGLWLAWDERHALGAVLVTCFGRAISEVGAVMIVGGNIEGFTRVMTTSIALETSKGDLPMALALGAVLMTVVLLLHALAGALQRWHRQDVQRPHAQRHADAHAEGAA